MISRNKCKKIGGVVLSALMVFSMTTTTFAQAIAGKKAVSLGADLTEAQKLQMLDEFKVIKDEATVIEVTNDDIRIQLGMDRSKPIPANSKSISSSYVEIIEKGKGIRVKTNNLTEVTSTMLMNALLTSGVTDANVIASAPYPVTGTAALAGILKGFEDVTGEELSLEQKEVAREEIKVTTDLGNVEKEDGTSLDKDEAAVIINEIKKEIIKESPDTDQQIENIVNDVTSNYGLQLPVEQRARVVGLMSDINSLDFDYKDMKDSLNKMSENLKETLSEMGKEIKESGIIEKIWNNIKEFVSKIFSFIESESNKTKEELKYDDNGNLVNDTVDEGDTTDASAPSDDVNHTQENTTEK